MVVMSRWNPSFLVLCRVNVELSALAAADDDDADTTIAGGIGSSISTSLKSS